MTSPTIVGREWLFVFLVFLSVAAVTGGLYWYGYTISDQHFLSSTYTNAGDVSVYLSLIEQARQGEIWLENLFTAEPSVSGMLHPLWLTLGMFARIFHLSSESVYHLARIVFVAAALAAAYALVSVFTPKISVRRIALLLFCFAAGFGWAVTPVYPPASYFNLSTLFFSISPDILLPELSGFMMLLHSPLLPAALAVELWIIYLVVTTSSRLARRAVGLFFLTVLLGLFHPYDLLTVFFISAVALTFFWLFGVAQGRSALPRQLLSKVVVIGSGVVTVAGYYLWLYARDDFFRYWTQSNFTESPSPWQLLLGFGLLLPLSVIGALALVKKNNAKIYIAAWAVSSLLLAYAPYGYQRRALHLLPLLLVLLAAEGIHLLWIRRHQALVIFTVALLPLTSVAIVRSNMLLYQRGVFYVDRSVVLAAEWLATSPEATVVLADWQTANRIPAFSGRRGYFGHSHQTIAVDQKIAAYGALLQLTTDRDKRQWLEQHNISHVLTTDSLFFSFLPIVYQTADVTIYQVL